MAVQFSTVILDTHIAPGVSAFTSAEIPDMTAWSKESSHWIANFFLNSAFSGSFTPPMNAYAYNFLRRAQFAFSEHDLARRSTLAFIANGGQSPRGYADALFHWERFLGQAWHGFSILITAGRKRLPEERWIVGTAIERAVQPDEACGVAHRQCPNDSGRHRASVAGK